MITQKIQDEYNSTIWLRIFTSIVLLLGFGKLVNFSRIFEKTGLTTELISQSTYDAIPFLVYFLALILLFAITIGQVGATFDNGDYSELPNFVVLIMQTYRNGIGDIAPPDYSYWTNAQVKDDHPSKLLIAYIWFGWLAGQFFILIVMLNFIIAVISESYNSVIAEKTKKRF